jgi:ribosomal-protein-alanine N-acetyltransferase
MSFNFPPLSTERLSLRALTQDDLDFVFRHFSDPEVNRYLFDEPPTTRIEQAQEIIDFYTQAESPSYNRRLLVRKSDGQTLGTCGYHKWQRAHQRAEIGFDLDPMVWKQGYMTEALTAALEFGFAKMALNRVSALVYPGNRASVRLLEKLNFQKDGALRSYYRKRDVFFDHWIYSLLIADWSGKVISHREQ